MPGERPAPGALPVEVPLPAVAAGPADDRADGGAEDGQDDRVFATSAD